MALFAINDAVLKVLSERMGTAQVMVLRGILGGTLLLGLTIATGAGARLADALHPPVLARTLFDAMASIMFVMALMGLPVATITALIQLVPILTSLAGVALFADPLTRRQMAALAIGLAGVLVVTRPFSGGVGLHLLFAVAAILLLTGRDIVTRWTAPTTPSLVVATCTTFAVPVLSMPELVFQGWQSLEPRNALLIGLIALCVAAGNFLMVIAVRRAPFPAIAPYRYSAIPFAMMAGLVLLGEIPDAAMIGGAAAIAFSAFLALPVQGRRTRPADV
ncbi:MAG: DMT family transporter [Rhizobiaceae bacterium]|nr:DMT family transporter [Rhizobiaceae bacterium]